MKIGEHAWTEFCFIVLFNTYVFVVFKKNSVNSGAKQYINQQGKEK